jgi:hypothetical protein
VATRTQIKRRGRLSLILGTLVAALMLAAVAYAVDGITVDGDDVTGTTLAFGSVCPDDVVNSDVQIGVRQQNANLVNSYGNGATVSVTRGTITNPNSANGALSAPASVGTITLPPDWNTARLNKTSTTVTTTVTLTVPSTATPGSYGTTATSNNIVYSGTGKEATSTGAQSSNDLTRNATVGVTWTVLSASHASCTPPDTAAPTSSATATANGSSYTFGDWTKYNVDVSLTGEDTGGSGLKEIRYTTDGTTPNATTGAIYSAAFTVSSEGTTTVKWLAIDNAGNVEAVHTASIKIDKTKPVITGSTGSYVPGTWTNQNVVVSFSCADNAGVANSGIASNNVAGTTLSTSGANQTFTNTGSCTDVAGNIADSTTVSDIDVDKDKPTISGAVTSPAAIDGANGWYTSAPTVTFTCGDALSGVASCVADGSSPPSASITLGESSSAQSVGGTATDNAGNSDTASVSGLKVDLSDPTVDSWSGSINQGDSFYFGSVPPAPTCAGSDSISGIASCLVTGYSTAVGTHTLTATATDNAGRTSTAQRSYTVLAWTLNGFYSPVDMNGVFNVVKNGATVPLKFEIFVGAIELTAITAVKSLTTAKVNCDATAPLDEIEATSTGGTSLRYDATAGQFVYNWQTPKTAGQCYRLTMTTQDDSKLEAYFKLK